MVRVKNGLQRHKSHKKYRKLAKGFRLGRKNVYKQIRLALWKQGQNAYIGRKLKKRDFRRLWISRLNGYLREKGVKYSTFMGVLNKQGVKLNRKMLSNIAILYPEVFDKIVGEVMSHKD